MNNMKGFTLVELLAVIVVLALIISIAVPATTTISNKMKDNLFCEKIKSIQNAASLYGEDRRESFSDEYDIPYKEYDKDKYIDKVGSFYGEKISVKDLVDKTYLKRDQNKAPYIVDPRDKDSDNLYNMKLIVYVKYDRIYIHFDETDSELKLAKIAKDANACIN